MSVALLSVGSYLVAILGFGALAFWHFQLAKVIVRKTADLPSAHWWELAKACLDDDRFRLAGKRWLQTVALMLAGLTIVLALFYFNSKLCLFPMSHDGLTLCGAD